MIIDSHAHIDFFENPDEIIKRSFEAGVGNIIIPSSDPRDFPRIVDICNRYPSIYWTPGVHPTEVENFKEDTLKEIAKYVQEDKNVVGLGEIGLDYHYSKENKEEQIRVFKLHLELAEALGLPVVIHDREAHKDTMDILASYKLKKVVMHCYSGSLELAKEAYNRGYYFGIGGVVTFKNAKTLKEVVEWLPLNRIMLETDCPYLTPHPFRGEQNEPSYLKFVIAEIANLKDLPANIVEEETTKNSLEFFNIKENHG